MSNGGSVSIHAKRPLLQKRSVGMLLARGAISRQIAMRELRADSQAGALLHPVVTSSAKLAA